MFFIYSCCQSITLCGPGPAALLICAAYIRFTHYVHVHATPCRAVLICMHSNGTTQNRRDHNSAEVFTKYEKKRAEHTNTRTSEAICGCWCCCHHRHRCDKTDCRSLSAFFVCARAPYIFVCLFSVYVRLTQWGIQTHANVIHTLFEHIAYEL